MCVADFMNVSNPTKELYNSLKYSISRRMRSLNCLTKVMWEYFGAMIFTNRTPSGNFLTLVSGWLPVSSKVKGL